MKRSVLFLIAAAALWAASLDHPTGQRTTPPVILSSAPEAFARGASTELTVIGYNLAGTSAVHFSESGVTGRILNVKELPDVPEPVRLGSGGLPATIDLGPLPPRHQVSMEVSVAPEQTVGPLRFRLETPLGLSPAMTALVEPYWGEMADKEPNDSIQQAIETPLPAVMAGTLGSPGDEDFFRIEVETGQEIVFLDHGSELGSELRPLFAILNEDYSIVREIGPTDSALASGSQIAFSHRFDKAGAFYIRVRDFEQGGGKKHKYRLLAGDFPVVTSVSPLGLPAGAKRTLRVSGLGFAAFDAPVTAKAEAPGLDFFQFRPLVNGTAAFNSLRVAVGEIANEQPSQGAGSIAKAQTVSIPTAIIGAIPEQAKGGPAAHYFRFHAAKGQTVVLDVMAQRAGSRLDSLVEVLHPDGRAVEQSTVRAVAQTFTTLAERNSTSTGLRLDSWKDYTVGDYLMVGREIIQVALLPRGPDEDVRFEAFPPTRPGSRSAGASARLTFFGTSPEAHAIDEPVYKVELHPPGSQFSANGLPLLRLPYSNDDGGPGYDKDSRLEFTAPADGDYIVRLRDVLGSGGPSHEYRLTLRAPHPDFQLFADPNSPNIPRGGRIPIIVTAFREDGFNGPIRVHVANLPPGITAQEAVIPPGSVSAILALEASPEANLAKAVPFELWGSAEIAGQKIERQAEPLDKLQLLALIPPPDVQMTAVTREVELEAGGQAEITVKIKRNNGFAGRVPVEVYGMPAFTDIPAFGLNGVLLNEDETERTFVINATERAQPGELTIYAAAKVETRSPLQNTFAGEPIRLRIKARQ